MGTLAEGMARHQNAKVEPDVNMFTGKTLDEMVGWVAKFGGAEKCRLRIFRTMREDGVRDAWWQVVPHDTALLNGGDPPSGDESHPCPPFTDC
jgi:hypothetical protein